MARSLRKPDVVERALTAGFGREVSLVGEVGAAVVTPGRSASSSGGLC
ncbi:hypothetical protein KCH_73930 [Kitasatospora cheerisanensis KCTC 2395]|uniref:Uncharacterized protein n=1 Tax=Kitasatospora cheerisanensis KCTC 2395 TaxID=1348663 RepID=A0A066YHD2_9ACTN|nr:hypothetical protein KCH_73930 [Kitasatospora cheerisanensis KCTC 2395]